MVAWLSGRYEKMDTAARKGLRLWRVPWPAFIGGRTGARSPRLTRGAA